MDLVDHKPSKMLQFFRVSGGESTALLPTSVAVDKTIKVSSTSDSGAYELRVLPDPADDKQIMLEVWGTDGLIRRTKVGKHCREVYQGGRGQLCSAPTAMHTGISIAPKRRVVLQVCSGIHPGARMRAKW